MPDVALRWITPTDRTPEGEALWEQRWRLHDAVLRDQRPDRVEVSDPDALRDVAAGATSPRFDLVALVDGRVVGAATLSVKRHVHPVLAYFFGGVHPDARRHGIGTALLAELVRCAREKGASRIEVGADRAVEGLGWADVTGYRPESAADRLLARAGFTRYQDTVVSRAPLDAARLEGLAARELARLAQEGRYTVEAVVGVPPESWFEPLARLREAMARDIPRGEAPPEEETWTAERVRQATTVWVEAGCTQVTALARTVDGTPVGYTETATAMGDPDGVMQGDTLVVGEHRGHGLGLALKAVAQRTVLERAPQARWSETCNAVENAPMIRVNRVLGYAPVSLAPQYGLDLA